MAEGTDGAIRMEMCGYLLNHLILVEVTLTEGLTGMFRPQVAAM
jgi:hypothetical protein